MNSHLPLMVMLVLAGCEQDQDTAGIDPRPKPGKQLYEIQRDWKEEKDLAAEKPAKLAEMKSVFFEVLEGIEKEGPSEWWKKEPPRSRASKKSQN